MKTQLLQDFQESGSTPSTPAPPPPSRQAPRRRPAVWHGPGAHRGEAGAPVQRADPGPLRRAPETSARGKGVAIEALADRIAAARTARPSPSPVDDATLPGSEARSRPAPPDVPERRPELRPDPPPELPPASSPPISDHVPPPRADADTVPRPVQPDIDAEWLAARLREEAVARETPAWTSTWKRRLVTWSIAGGLLAGLAAGGLWLYEENRVEDALVVVANTSPARQPPAAAAFVAATPEPVQPVQPVVTAEPVQPVSEVSEAPVAPVVADEAPAAAPVDVTPPRRALRNKPPANKRTTAKARRTTAKEAPPIAAEPSPRRRREETLMQCRAHGYDARQCIERACTMTRFGLACKG